MLSDKASGFHHLFNVNTMMTTQRRRGGGSAPASRPAYTLMDKQKTLCWHSEVVMIANYYFFEGNERSWLYFLTWIWHLKSLKMNCTGATPAWQLSSLGQWDTSVQDFLHLRHHYAHPIPYVKVLAAVYSAMPLFWNPNMSDSLLFLRITSNITEVNKGQRTKNLNQTILTEEDNMLPIRSGAVGSGIQQ